MRFSEKQLETIRRPFVDSTLEVLEGSPRSGKTTAGAFRYARFLIETEDENHLVLGYSQEQAYKLLIESDGMGLMHIFAGCCKLRDDENGKHLLIHTPKGDRRVYYKGGGDSSSYKSFQGLSLGSVYFCEIDLITMPTIQEAFRRTFASKLRVHFADLNPPSPQHPVIKDVFEVQNTIWSHWTMDDNPIITKERKLELYRILSKNPFLLERDWYGRRCIPQGVIYSMFSHKDNLLAELPKDEEKVEMFFSGDGGLKDATSVICWIVTRKDGRFFLNAVNEYYYSGRDTGFTKALSIQAREITKDFMPYCLRKWDMSWSEVQIDPACLALREELRQCGVETRGADNNAHSVKGNSKGIAVGIERTQSLIAERVLRVIDTDQWGHYDLLRELTMYVVDQHGNPVDMYNHAMDAMRYGVNYFVRNYRMNVI